MRVKCYPPNISGIRKMAKESRFAGIILILGNFKKCQIISFIKMQVKVG